MGRRSYHNAEVFIGDDLEVASGTVTFDSIKKELTIKNGTDRTVYEGVTLPTGPEVRGKDRVRTWTLADGVVVTAITAGCGPCGR